MLTFWLTVMMHKNSEFMFYCSTSASSRLAKKFFNTQNNVFLKSNIDSISRVCEGLKNMWTANKKKQTRLWDCWLVLSMILFEELSRWTLTTAICSLFLLCNKVLQIYWLLPLALIPVRRVVLKKQCWLGDLKETLQCLNLFKHSSSKEPPWSPLQYYFRKWWRMAHHIWDKCTPMFQNLFKALINHKEGLFNLANSPHVYMLWLNFILGLNFVFLCFWVW